MFQDISLPELNLSDKIPDEDHDAILSQDNVDVFLNPQKRRRFSIKLHLLGNSAGIFSLFLILGAIAFIVLNAIPNSLSVAGWAIPLLTSVIILFGVYYTRRKQYENPDTRWYIELLVAMLLAGTTWAAFLVGLLNITDHLSQTAGVLILFSIIFIGGVIFAVDLMVVGTFLFGLTIAFFLNVTIFGIQINNLPLLWLTAITMLAALILFAWSFRQQRLFVRALAELSILRPYYKTTKLELVEFKNRLETQTQQQKQVETEIKQAKEAAESASVAKTEFLATMSHEIRTPLNGIVPILEMLRESELNAEQTEFVTTALNSSHHLLNLINDILDYSKIEAGKLELESIEININELIESVISLMTKSAERRHLRLKNKISANVPQQVRGDPFRLRQILTNLVGNAIKFTEHGSVSVEVSRHATSPKEVAMLFAVRDTGIGMSQDAVGQLFQLFAQADASTTRKYGGTGLGLVICRRLVEMMGGRIGVKSELGKGSVFWFVVPMRKALHEVPSARQNLKGARALFVGFDELEHQRVVAYFNDWGMLNEQASNVTDALTKLKTSARLGSNWCFDVLMIDAQIGIMPITNLLQDIRKIFELSTLVIIAVDTFPSLVAALKEANISEIIPRPVQEQELRSRLHRLLDVQIRRAGKSSEEQRPLLMPDAAYSWEDGQRTRIGTQAISENNTIYENLDAPLIGNVLVVEDNPVNLSVVTKLLQRFGLSCDVAHDGVEGVEAVKNIKYDIVLMDMQMPKMDGYQATSNIRAREKECNLSHVPILAMTANAMAGDREKCLEAGMDDYISKPIKPSDLKKLLRHWLKVPEVLAIQNANNNSSSSYLSSNVDYNVAHNTTSNMEESVLDKGVLGELFDIMEKEAIQLLQEYLRNAHELLKNIESAIRNNDITMLTLPAHTLKSSSANVGAMQVSAIAKQLEIIGREKNFNEATVYWKSMQIAYAQAELALLDIIQRGTL
jgi:signal transduction histidine kinase/CheY-like chemotaxis protein